jgi:hypothetical protein
MGTTVNLVTTSNGSLSLADARFFTQRQRASPKRDVNKTTTE